MKKTALIGIGVGVGVLVVTLVVCGFAFNWFGGSEVSVDNDEIINVENNNMDYKANLEKALFGELEAVKRYRKIMGTMPSGNPYTLLMSIMTDELRHASKYNFLIHNAK